MNRKRAEEYYEPVILCPFCEHLEGTVKGLDNARERMIDHMVKKHTDEEAIDLNGWIGLYPEEKEELKDEN